MKKNCKKILASWIIVRSKNEFNFHVENVLETIQWKEIIM